MPLDKLALGPHVRRRGGPFPTYDRSFTYSKLSYADFVTSLSATGATLADEGACSDGTTHIWSATVGNTATKPVIWIEAQIHGDHEWRQAYILRQFLTKLVTPDARDTRMARLIKERFAFYTIPVLNPYGYINSSYTNANDVNVLVNFDYKWAEFDEDPPIGNKGAAPFDQVESALVRDKVNALRPVVFIDLHVVGNVAHVWGIHDRYSWSRAAPLGRMFRWSSQTLKASDPDLYPYRFFTEMDYPYASNWVSRLAWYPLVLILETPSTVTEQQMSKPILDFLWRTCYMMASTYPAHLGGRTLTLATTDVAYE